MPASTAESLRLINDKLCAVLSVWQSKPGEPSTFTPTVFTALLAELHRAAELLGGVSSSAAPDPQLEDEISDYRRNVQQLEIALPKIQGRLLIEKARLENARSHLAAASAWAEARKKTL